jgi:hypothetical protein
MLTLINTIKQKGTINVITIELSAAPPMVLIDLASLALANSFGISID